MTFAPERYGIDTRRSPDPHRRLDNQTRAAGVLLDVMVVAALLLLVGLVSAPVWLLRRVWPPPVLAGSAPPAGGRGPRAATEPGASSSARRARTAWRALVLLGVLLLAFGWAMGVVIEEARIYAEGHGMTADDGEPQRTQQKAVLGCAGVLLLGAVLLRSSFARRQET